MSLIQEYISHIKQAENDLEKVAQKAIFDNEDIVLGLLKEQIANSEDSTGHTFDNYADSTENYWRYADPPISSQFPNKTTSNAYTLVWSGNWIKSIYINIDNEGFDFLSSDPKDSIVEGYSKGGKIKKLNEKNLKNVNNEIVLPALYEYLFRKMTDF